eukprot:gene1504-12121_t
MLKDLFPQNVSLLMGISKSGKTTLFKQIKYHYLNQIASENELSLIYVSMMLDVKKIVDVDENLNFLKENYEKIFKGNNFGIIEIKK